MGKRVALTYDTYIWQFLGDLYRSHRVMNVVLHRKSLDLLGPECRKFDC